MESECTEMRVNSRILVIDDNGAIHDDFRKILGGGAALPPSLHAAEAALFGESASVCRQAEFELDSAFQGEAALEMVKRAREVDRPYAMAFVDMRMPPGWDGLTTIRQLWSADPEILAVICTAYSDLGWEEIQAALTERERWLVLKKPFDKIEVMQLANALTAKWALSRTANLKMEALERMAETRTLDLRRAHRVQSEFLANMSHELFTPLNGICGFLGLLAETTLDESQTEYVRDAAQSGERLYGLLSRVLEFNRAEAGLLHVEATEFSPAQLISEGAEAYASEAVRKRIVLRVGAGPGMEQCWVGPSGIIAKVLGLLLDNAIKFTPSGVVALEVHPAGVGLEFLVTDTGIGLTPQQIEWIRVPFAQVDGGAPRRSSGIGLGLPLADRLVRAIGGNLKLEAIPDHGVKASFTAAATRLECPTAAGGEGTAQDADRTGACILLGNSR